MMSLHRPSSARPAREMMGGLSAQSLIRSPRGGQLLAVALMLAFVGVIFALVFVPWVQTAVGDGQVIAFTPLERQQTVDAPIKGRVTQWYVREGQRVEEGQAIVMLSDNDPQFTERLEQTLQTLREQVRAIDAKALAYQTKFELLSGARERELMMVEAKISQLESKVESVGQKLRAEQIKRDVAELNLDRVRSLTGEGLASQRKLEVAQMKYDTAAAGVKAGRAERRAAVGALKGERAYLEKVRLDTLAKVASAEAELHDAISSRAKSRSEIIKLEGKLASQGNQLVKAPLKGTILKLFAAPGATQLKVGDPLVVLVPDATQRAVGLWVDGNDMPLIQSGEEVRLQFEGWPAVQFSGWPSLAIGTFGGLVAFVDSTTNDEGKFRVVVVEPPGEPWPEPRYLRQGVRVRGWVLLSEVSLGFELWRQINGFPPAIDQDPGAKKKPGGAGKAGSKDGGGK